MGSDEPLYPDVTVQLVGLDGNAFSIIGRVRAALRDAGHLEAFKQFPKEAMAADDYDHCLRIVMKYVGVE
jgi:hypothetical protein